MNSKKKNIYDPFNHGPGLDLDPAKYIKAMKGEIKMARKKSNPPPPPASPPKRIIKEDVDFSLLFCWVKRFLKCQ